MYLRFISIKPHCFHQNILSLHYRIDVFLEALQDKEMERNSLVSKS
ncbi:hypothetical protein HMPREF0653_00506 [Prevotella disiens JCM 6334 = ATCC 29426]|uniref:Uncharacterized protein n=1 Tax=Prevotella disiens JCM 6334 = ATCC 29426 TaxID=1235811 RepID=A0ABP2Y9S9_9BACT|nr:hypothetical protein HMPREF0653_00506 [Prevotella disiens JCM 6334 = ATCC 29426]